MNPQKQTLKTAHSFTDYLAWTLFAAIPILTAVYAISRVSAAWTAIYILVLAFCFLGIEYRFFCTHCPHYKNNGGKTCCLLLWHVPAYFKPRPGPLEFYDKIFTFLGFVIAIGFPLSWLLAYPLLLLLYIISWALIGIFLVKYECSRCINRNCPMNTVADDIKSPGSPGKSNDKK